MMFEFMCSNCNQSYGTHYGFILLEINAPEDYPMEDDRFKFCTLTCMKKWLK